jgi:hypothetical protein
MAGRHWLDPLARRLLEATGQLPPLPPSPPQPGAAGKGVEEAVERELLALKLALNPALRFRDGAELRQAAALGWRSTSPRPVTGCGCPAAPLSWWTG